MNNLRKSNLSVNVINMLMIAVLCIMMASCSKRFSGDEFKSIIASNGISKYELVENSYEFNAALFRDKMADGYGETFGCLVTSSSYFGGSSSQKYLSNNNDGMKEVPGKDIFIGSSFVVKGRFICLFVNNITLLGKVEKVVFVYKNKNRVVALKTSVGGFFARAKMSDGEPIKVIFIDRKGLQIGEYSLEGV